MMIIFILQLFKGVEFLKRNSIFACIGSSYIYSCFKNEVYLNKLRFNHHNIISNDRLKECFNLLKITVNSLLFYIYQKVFKHITKIWKKLQKRYKDKFLLFPEIIVTITICFLGKIKYFQIYTGYEVDEVKNRIEYKSLHKFIKKNHSYDKLFEYLSSKLDTNYFDYFIYSFKNLNTEILKKSGNEKFKKNLIYFYKTRSEIKKNKITNRLIPLKNTIALFFPSFLKKRIRFYFKINGPKLSEFVRSNNKLFLNKKDVNLLKEFLIY